MQRASGILMHISSLPSPYGIGTLGKEAYAFADFLLEAGQKYWQMLPLGHTGYGDSPYQVFSMYAGNPYFVDLDLLLEDGLLLQDEISSLNWGENARFVYYSRIHATRIDTLKKAFLRLSPNQKEQVRLFRQQEAFWVDDYALFMALKRRFNMRPLFEWPDEQIRHRKPDALEKATTALQDEIEFYVFVQFYFFKQWNELRDYAKKIGLGLIGDLPIYVSPDSVDVWVHPEYYQLDKNRRPIAVAGVPPDYFSATGQLWGNPLYDWEAIRSDGYRLWLDRFQMTASQFDIVRIDHFRGFESYWSVPYGQSTALNGEWRKGPGLELVRLLQKQFPNTGIIAEDLGDMTPGLVEFVQESGLPGMKVLQFAFDAKEQSSHLPHWYPRHCVCYTGTHDNTTAVGWLNKLTDEDAQFARNYLGLNDNEGVHWGLIRGGSASVADLFIAQMQDLLGLDDNHRMNTPATLGNNWRWRMLNGEATQALAKKMRSYTSLYGRTPQ